MICFCESQQKQPDVRRTNVLLIIDQDKGAELLKRVLCGYVDADILAKYTVLAGTYSLVNFELAGYSCNHHIHSKNVKHAPQLRYVENCAGISFGERSLRLSISMERRGRMWCVRTPSPLYSTVPM